MYTSVWCGRGTADVGHRALPSPFIPLWFPFSAGRVGCLGEVVQCFLGVLFPCGWHCGGTKLPTQPIILFFPKSHTLVGFFFLPSLLFHATLVPGLPFVFSYLFKSAWRSVALIHLKTSSVFFWSHFAFLKALLRFFYLSFLFFLVELMDSRPGFV